MKKARITVLYILIIIAIVLSSCINNAEIAPSGLEGSFVGEKYEMTSDFINTKTVTMYYPDTTNDNLVRVVKEISILQGSSEVKVVANKLLNTTLTEEDNYSVPFGGNVSLGWLVVSRNLAEINLIGDFSVLTEKEILAGIVSIVNTLCEINTIEYVEIMLNGSQFVNRGLLVNPMTTNSSSLHLMYLDHINIIEDEQRKMTKNKNILYFLDKDSNFLIAEISNITIGKEKAAEDLFKLLKNEPYYGSGIKSCIPQNVLMSTSAIVEEEDGQNIITIRLESPKIETMDNKTRYMMCGGIALTLLSYYDNVSAVRILINGQPALEESLLTKEMFIENIGQIVTVYMPNSDLEYLIKIDFAMSQTRYNNPTERVLEIISADGDYKTNTSKIIPEGITKDDVLSVVVHDSCCFVNISENLYSKIKVLPYKNRKMFLYSLVNTLTELENVNSVQILVDDAVYEKLGDNLYIETAILNNPGIVFD
ncbi:MAG: GerMN domain-containing protein [Eubacteriales bacterium]